MPYASNILFDCTLYLLQILVLFFLQVTISKSSLFFLKQFRTDYFFYYLFFVLLIFVPQIFYTRLTVLSNFQ